MMLIMIYKTWNKIVLFSLFLSNVSCFLLWLFLTLLFGNFVDRLQSLTTDSPDADLLCMFWERSQQPICAGKCFTFSLFFSLLKDKEIWLQPKWNNENKNCFVVDFVCVCARACMRECCFCVFTQNWWWPTFYGWGWVLEKLKLFFLFVYRMK